MAKFATIEIDENGEISVELDGFKGVGCAAVMDTLTKGSKVTHRQKKPEYRTTTTTTVCAK